MSQDDEPPRRRWRKWLLWLGVPFVIVFILPVAIFAVIILWDRHVADRELEEVCAELDQTDPGWRLEEIEAALPDVPDSENGAVRVAAVMAKLPAHHANWLSRPLEQQLSELQPPEQLTREQRAELTNALQDVAPAVEEALAFAKLSRGRYTIQWSANPQESSDGAIQDVRSVAYLLRLHALWRAQENDVEGAWVSSQAIYNAGRSLGAPQYLNPLLVRNAIRSVALYSMQQTLAQGNVSETVLAKTQQVLEEDAALPLLHQALRGERAVMDRFFVNLETGVLPMSTIRGPGIRPWLEQLDSPKLYVPRNHAWYLRHMKDVIDAADRSPQALTQLVFQIDNNARNSPLLACLLLIPCDRTATSYYAAQAKLQSAIVALAVERYRLKHGRWPDQTADVTPAFLEELPLDPFDGKPLRYLQSADYVTVYSVGVDGKDDGGNLSDSREAGTDIGFRLWNPAQRRQPPKPKAPKNPDDAN